MLGLAVCLPACGAPPAVAPPAAALPPEASAASSEPSAPAPASPQPAPSAAAAQPAYPVPDTNPSPGEGHDFKDELTALYRVVACAGDTPIPKTMDAAVVDKHCTRVEQLVKQYRERFIAKAQPFFDGIRPKQLPPTVVYPFGGGDLLSPLLVFPDALEITTISLEYAGDPRGLTSKYDKNALEVGLTLFAESFRTILRGDWNWTRNMEALQKARFPEQLGYAMIALAVHDYRPQSLRFFRLKGDGSIDYLDDAELEALANVPPQQLPEWGSPDHSLAFANAEIRFSKPGGPVKVFRHMVANLSNKGLGKDLPELLVHLKKKGKVSATTRAASHLLWSPSFTDIRDYLSENLVWMPSDSTGITPEDAQAAGLVQDYYGTFEGMYEPSDQDPRPRETSEAIKRLFKEKSTTNLDFLYGYSDNRRIDAKAPRIGHVIVTRRP
jgi:hypothetical protein